MKNLDLFKLLTGLAEFYKTYQTEKPLSKTNQSLDQTIDAKEQENSLFNLFSRTPWFNGAKQNSDRQTATQTPSNFESELERKNSAKSKTTSHNSKNLREDFLCPLQEQMIYTMRSHDEFLKRVKNSQKLGNFSKIKVDKS